MANFFETPEIQQTPLPDPPGFDLLRKMLMEKSFQLNSNPYGLNPGFQGGASDIYRNGPSRGFNPYGDGQRQGMGMRRPQGGPQQGGQQQGGMGGGMGQMGWPQNGPNSAGPPQGGMGGGQRDQEMPPGYNPGPKGTFGMAGGGQQGGGGFMQMIQQLMQQMRGGGGARTMPMRGGGGGPGGYSVPGQSTGGPDPIGGMHGSWEDPNYDKAAPGGPPGMATPPQQSPDMGVQDKQDNVPDRSRKEDASYDGDPYSGWQPGRFSTPQSILQSGQQQQTGATEQPARDDGYGSGGYDGLRLGSMSHDLGNRTSDGPSQQGGPSGGMRQLGQLISHLRQGRGRPSRFGSPQRGFGGR